MRAIRVEIDALPSVCEWRVNRLLACVGGSSIFWVQENRVYKRGQFPRCTGCRRMNKRRFRIAFSYSSFRKTFVESVVSILTAEHPIKTLMQDCLHEAEITGADSDLRLQQIYKQDSEVVVVCLCKSWLASQWCTKEWRAIRGLLGTKDSFRLLFLEFERVTVPGLDFASTDTAVEIGNKKPEEIAALISNRLKLVRAKRDDETLVQLEEVVANNIQFGNTQTETDSWHQRSSNALANWPKTLPDGRRIERPELAKIFEKVAGSRRSTHVLLGPPGSGKSALLSELYTKCIDRSWSVLGIKCDALPSAIATRSQLSEIMCKGLEIEQEIRRDAMCRKTVIIFDQLDALGDLVDMRGERLSVLLNLVNDLEQIDNVHLVMSSRIQELYHDFRLSALLKKQNPKIDVWTLSELSDEDVQSAIGRIAWSPSDKWMEWLKLPYNLCQLLSHPVLGEKLSEIDAIPSIHDFHDERWKRLLSKPNSLEKGETLNRLAGQIESTEEFWQSIEMLGCSEETVSQLVADDWLKTAKSEVGVQSVTFRHQLQYEYFLVKRFMDAPNDFLQEVLEKQETLFCRPMIWQVLVSMRARNRSAYRLVLEQLVKHASNGTLRRHVVHLLQDFVAELIEPDSIETQWTSQCLLDAKLATRMAGVVVKAFSRTKIPDLIRSVIASALPQMIAKTPGECWPAVVILRTAIHIDEPKCKDLLRKHWAFNSAYTDLLRRVLEEYPCLDQEVTNWISYSIGSTDRDVEHLILSAFTKPRNGFFASQIVAAELRHRLSTAQNEYVRNCPKRATFGETEGFVEAMGRFDRRHRKNVELGRGFSFAREVAEEHPEDFLKTVFPLLIQTMEFCGYRRQSTLCQYRECLGYGLLPNKFENSDALPSAIVKAIGSVAKQDSLEFIRFVQEYAYLDSLPVHVWLQNGLRSIVADEPEFVLSYLIEDPRRLAVDQTEHSHSHFLSIGILKDVAKVIDVNGLNRLQSCLHSWNYYWSEVDRKEVYGELESNARSLLLRIIPEEHRSQQTIDQLKQNQFWLIKHDEELKATLTRRGIKTEMFGPRVLPTDLYSMSDEALRARLSQEQTTIIPTEGSQEYRETKTAGGLLMLGQSNIAEGIRRLAVLKLPDHEDGIKCLLQGLVSTKDADAVTACTKYLTDSGMSFSRRNQNDVGSVISELISLGARFTDKTIETIESWCFMWHDVTVDSKATTEPRSTWETRDQKENRVKSILSMDERIGHGLEHPTWLLEAVRRYCWAQEKPEKSRWRSFLRRLDTERFSDDFWIGVFWIWRHSLNDKATAKCVWSIVSRRLGILCSDDGALMAIVFGHLWTSKMRRTVLMTIRRVKDKRARRVYGELVLLFALREKDEYASKMLARLVSKTTPKSEVHRGLISAAAHVWYYLPWRLDCTRVLSAILDREESDLTAIMLDNLDFYQDCFRMDEHTVEILDFLSKQIWRSQSPLSTELVESLSKFAEQYPDLVFRILSRIIEAFPRDGNIFEFMHLPAQEELCKLMLTMQRLVTRDRRKELLTLIEDAQEIGLYGAILEIERVTR